MEGKRRTRDALKAVGLIVSERKTPQAAGSRQGGFNSTGFLGGALPRSVIIYGVAFFGFNNLAWLFCWRAPPSIAIGPFNSCGFGLQI